MKVHKEQKKVQINLGWIWRQYKRTTQIKQRRDTVNARIGVNLETEEKITQVKYLRDIYTKIEINLDTDQENDISIACNGHLHTSSGINWTHDKKFHRKIYEDTSYNPSRVNSDAKQQENCTNIAYNGHLLHQHWDESRYKTRKIQK